MSLHAWIGDHNNLTGADLSFASLTGATLEHCETGGVSFVKAKYEIEEFCAKGWLQGAVLGDVVWRGKTLVGAQLRGVSLVGASLTGTDLTGAALTNANFSKADLTGAILMDSDCEGARFDGTKLDQVLWLPTRH